MRVALASFILAAGCAAPAPPAPAAAQASGPSCDHPRSFSDVRAYVAACGRDETVALTRTLVAFPTVGEQEPAPTGRAFAEMAAFLRQWAAEAGLGFAVHGPNDVWEISLGEGRRQVGFLMHADVVPADPAAWKRDPFDAWIEEGQLYGRGTEDDKGPIASTLVAMKALAAFGHRPNGQIVAILGTGEESDWDGMTRFAEQVPHPTHVVSVDASFPVVIAESGFVAWRLTASGKFASGKGPRIADATGGEFLTQVPGEATMKLVPNKETVDALLFRARAASEAEVAARGAPFRAEAEKEGSQVVVRAHGEACHSSTADECHNALWLLAGIAHRLEPAPGSAQALLRLIHERLSGEHYGERLGMHYRDEKMGPLLVSPTVLKMEGDRLQLSINMRRPIGRSKAEFAAMLARALSEAQKTISPAIEQAAEPYIGDPAVADTTGTLVPTLIDIYRAETGDPRSEPISIRGGTYARLFRGAVSFGPSMPGKPYRGHAPNESIEIETLEKLTKMLLEAALRLDGVTAP